MDYSRIYQRLIADRRENPPTPGDYTESHHIVPRALGGGNEAANLICLRAADHYFAHLLLAKIHGGLLWSAVFLMAGTRRYNKVDAIVGKRVIYGMAKREFAKTQIGKEGLKGSANGNHNPTVFDWKNIHTGELRSATLAEMWQQFGGGRATWTSAVSGYRNRAGDWTLKSNDAKRGLKGRPCAFVHRDGRTYLGTQKQFAAMACVSLPSASRVCRHGDVTLSGWRLSGVPDRAPSATKDGRTSGAQGRGKTYTLRRLDGEPISGQATALAQRFGVQVNSMRALIYELSSGKLPHYRRMTLG